MQLVFGDIKNAGLFKFVSAWYVKVTRYMDLCRSGDNRGEVAAPTTKADFVLTNSITQCEQVGVLWSWMLAQGVKIHFLIALLAGVMKPKVKLLCIV